MKGEVKVGCCVIYHHFRFPSQRVPNVLKIKPIRVGAPNDDREYILVNCILYWVVLFRCVITR